MYITFIYYIYIIYIYIHIYIYIIELKNDGVKLYGNLQFVSRITNCVFIQIMLIGIFLDLIHVIE